VPILKFLSILIEPRATPPMPLYQLLSNPLLGSSTKSVMPIYAYLSKFLGEPMTPTEKGSFVASVKAYAPKYTVNSVMKSY